jgi:hypothetical protein
MSTAKLKRLASTHYLLVGSAVAGECFLDRDGNTIVLRLAKGTTLSLAREEVPTRTAAAPSRLPLESIA